ncbi:MAG: carboxymuconolactone decarboxylase family protein [Gemmatimonadaceae bacterium]
MEREPRVPRLAAEGVEAPVGEVFDAFLRERGKVPNLFRVAAHRPEIVTTLRAHMNAVMGSGTVDVLLKELLAVRVSQINNCEY